MTIDQFRVHVHEHAHAFEYYYYASFYHEMLAYQYIIHIFYYITTYKCCNKNQIALDRSRTDDLAVNSRTLYLLSYEGKQQTKQTLCEYSGSNRRPLRCKHSALPTALYSQKQTLTPPPRGLEPRTTRLKA